MNVKTLASRFLIILLLPLLAAPAAAGVNRWTLEGPFEGFVPAVAIDPNDPRTVYAVSEGGGVFKSTDGGDSWRVVLTGFSHRVLAFDPSRPGTLYAVEYSVGAYKTTDGGDSWTYFRISSGVGVTDFVVDPSDPQTLYLGSRRRFPGEGLAVGVLKSTDGGASWSRFNNGINVNAREISRLVIDPSAPRTLYLGCPAGVFKTTDGAASWQAASDGLGDSDDVSQLAIDPADPRTLYAATASGLFKTTDGALNWLAVGAGLPVGTLTDLRIDPRSSDTLYATAGDGADRFFRSTDGGLTWTVLGSGLTDVAVEDLTVDPVDSRRLLVGSAGQGIFRSIDGGATWSPANQGLRGAFVQDIAIDPLDGRSIWVATWRGTPYGTVYRSTDAGASWERTDTGLPLIDMDTLAVAPSDPSVLYVGTRGFHDPASGVYRTDDGGDSWRQVLADQAVELVEVDPQDPEVVYAQTRDDGLLQSTDGGASWQALDLPRTALALVIDPQDTAVLYADRFKSADRGATWTGMPIPTSGPSSRINSLAIDPRDTSVLYAGVNEDGAFKSTDAGATWTRLDALPNDRGVWSLAIDPLDSRIVYAADRLGVFRSADRGLSWTPMNRGLRFGARLGNLTIDPLDPRTLYASEGDGGLWVYRQRTGTVGGRVWRDADGDGLQGPDEEGVVGIAVRLLNNATAVTLAVTESGVNGIYGFDELARGEYLVEVELPEGFRFSPPNSAGGDFDSDVDPASGRTATVPLGPAASNLDVNAGLVPLERVIGLRDGRFEVEVEWRDFQGATGPGYLVRVPGGGRALSDDSGLFYFFQEDNWELLVKVLDGCGFNDRFWVFSAATTNVEYRLRVTDTVSGQARDYVNPLGIAAAAVTDTSAFACP